LSTNKTEDGHDAMYNFAKSFGESPAAKALRLHNAAQADAAAVAVAVADFADAFGFVGQGAVGKNAPVAQPFQLGDAVLIQSAIYAEKEGTVVQTASRDRKYKHPIGVEIGGGRIEFFTVDGCDVTGARALYHKTAANE
jgi:hypothetical protein